MQKDFTQVAFITGAGRRIGAEIARILHDSGMNVVLHYNKSQAEAEQLCHAFNKKRLNSAILLQSDLLEINSLDDLTQKAAKHWGRLDALINNASRFYPTPLAEATLGAWDDLLGSNVRAPFFLSQAAMPYLKESQGCIVNIADIHADRPMRDYSIYCISKAALLMLTKSLAKELGPEVRVNAVSPGPVMWPENENVLSNEVKETLIKQTVLDCEGSPEEIAKAVLFLVKNANYITGQILAVDGGRSLQI